MSRLTIFEKFKLLVLSLLPNVSLLPQLFPFFLTFPFFLNSFPCRIHSVQERGVEFVGGDKSRVRCTKIHVSRLVLWYKVSNLHFKLQRSRYWTAQQYCLNKDTRNRFVSVFTLVPVHFLLSPFLLRDWKLSNPLYSSNPSLLQINEREREREGNVIAC